MVFCGSVAGILILLLPLKEMKANSLGVAVTALSFLIIAYALKNIVPLLDYFTAFYNSETDTAFKTLTKVLGITLICNLVSDMATDFGMGSIAGKIEFVGKVAVLLSAMPLLDSLLSQVEGFV